MASALGLFLPDKAMKVTKTMTVSKAYFVVWKRETLLLTYCDIQTTKYVLSLCLYVLCVCISSGDKVRSAASRRRGTISVIQLLQLSGCGTAASGRQSTVSVFACMCFMCVSVA